MTIKEEAHTLIDSLSDEQVFHITKILLSMKWLNIEEVHPDKIDLAMLEEIENNPDCKKFISQEDLLKELGI